MGYAHSHCTDESCVYEEQNCPKFVPMRREPVTVMSLYPPPIEPTYYVSGPISGDVVGNTKKFASAVKALRARDYKVVSPVEVCEALTVPNPEDWAWYMRRDIEAMMQDEVQGIIMLPGWEHSEGARLELLIARGLAMRVHSLGECLVREPVLEIRS